jgi:hypothetical protein
MNHSVFWKRNCLRNGNLLSGTGLATSHSNEYILEPPATATGIGTSHSNWYWNLPKQQAMKPPTSTVKEMFTAL